MRLAQRDTTHDDGHHAKMVATIQPTLPLRYLDLLNLSTSAAALLPATRRLCSGEVLSAPWTFFAASCAAAAAERFALTASLSCPPGDSPSCCFPSSAGPATIDTPFAHECRPAHTAAG